MKIIRLQFIDAMSKKESLGDTRSGFRMLFGVGALPWTRGFTTSYFVGFKYVDRPFDDHRYMCRSY